MLIEIKPFANQPLKLLNGSKNHKIKMMMMRKKKKMKKKMKAKILI